MHPGDGEASVSMVHSSPGTTWINHISPEKLALSPPSYMVLHEEPLTIPEGRVFPIPVALPL